jgi:hypothetical protein
MLTLIHEGSLFVCVLCVRSDGEPRDGETANGRVDTRVQGSAPPHTCASPDIFRQIFHSRHFFMPPRYYMFLLVESSGGFMVLSSPHFRLNGTISFLLYPHITLSLLFHDRPSPPQRLQEAESARDRWHRQFLDLNVRHTALNSEFEDLRQRTKAADGQYDELDAKNAALADGMRMGLCRDCLRVDCF